jgi:hypothetical protein
MKKLNQWFARLPENWRRFVLFVGGHLAWELLKHGVVEGARFLLWLLS